jgi:hypothetical protein
MAEQSMPAIGTRVVHKDDHAKSQGPLWHVTGTDPPKNSVRLRHVPNAKANRDLAPETRDVKLPDFHRDYVQM